MKKLLLGLLFAGAACAQNYMLVTASKIEDASGSLLPSGQVCFQGVATNGTPIPFMAGGGGAVHMTPVCSPVASGVMTTVSIANSGLTYPVNVAYLITITDNLSGSVISQLGPTQISCSITPLNNACAGVTNNAGWNLNLFQPGNSPLALIQNGPAGPTGPASTVTSPISGDLHVMGDTYFDGGLTDGTPVENVRNSSCGVKGDGVTDDSTAIQSCINAALARANANGTLGGAVYLPAGQYYITKTINVTKLMAGGLTIYGDGPHATQILVPTTGFAGTSVFNINSNGGALIFRDMAVIAESGGLPGVDGIYTTGNGQFFSRLWFGGWGSTTGSQAAGIHAYLAANIMISECVAEHNYYGYWFDTPTGGDSLSNSQTYHNIVSGVQLTGQIPSTSIGGTGGQAPGVLISTVGMVEDLTGGGGNAAIYSNTNAPLVIDSVTIDSANNGFPPTGLFFDTGAGQVAISNLHVNHAMNYGLYAKAGFFTINGGVIENLGSYSTITVPTGGYSSTTQSAAIYASPSVSSLIVKGITINNVAGFGILSSAAYQNISGNFINNFGLGNSSGGQRNSTTGLTAISLTQYQSYDQVVVIGNEIAAASASALTAFQLSYNSGISLATHAIRAVQNSVSAAFGTLLSTNLTTAQLQSQDIDLDNTTRLAGGHVISTGYASELDIATGVGGGGGNPSVHLADLLSGSYSDVGLVMQPNTYGFLYAEKQGTGPLPLYLQSAGGRVIFGNLNVDNGTDEVQVNGSVNATAYKAGAAAGFSGTKTAGSCVITFSGGIVTNVTGC